MAKKKILLINPLNQNYVKRLFPPLSLTTIAAYIPRTYDVEILDENLEKIHYNADLIALTVNTYTAKRSYEIARKCHELHIPVILGGIHPTILPNEAKDYANCVVIGESEKIWIKLLKDYENGSLKKFYKAHLYDFKREKVKIPRRDLLN